MSDKKGILAITGSIAAVCAALLSFPAHAQEEDVIGSHLDSPYVIPMLTYTNASPRRHTENAWGGELVFGFPVGENSRFEIGAFYELFNGNKHPDYEVTGAMLGLVQPVVDIEKYHVFVDGRIMLTHNDDNIDQYKAAAFSVAVGVERDLPVFGLRLRTEVGVRQMLLSGSTPDDADYGEWQARIGLMKAFDWERPHTPAGDQDHDGVPDDRDACPDTLAGDKVDDRGCSVPALTLIYFPFGSDELTVSAKQQLDHIAKSAGAWWSADSDRRPYVIAVLGGALPPGAQPRSADELSKRRLQKVSDYLQSRGILESMIEGPEQKGVVPMRIRGPRPVVELRVINP